MADESVYFESKEFKNILKQYEESVKSGHPAYMDADDLADIADYYHFYCRYDEAQAAIELALKYNPDAIGPLLYKAREALVQNDYETAHEYQARIEAIDSQEGLYFKGEILICQGKAEEADELFRQQLKEVYPDELIDYVYDVAHLFSDYNLHEKAFEWIARSKGDDSDEFKELMGCTLFGLGKYKDSERIFNELIDHDPYSIRYWNALANAQFMNEDYKSSITSSEYAIAINPNNAESVLSKANGLYSLGNFESAYAYFQRYSEMMPNDDFGYLHQGTCLINLGRSADAIKVLEKGAQVAEPDSQYLPEIYQELAFAYSEQHQLDNALYYIDKTELLDCDHVNMEVIRGHILLYNNNMEKAEQAFKKALQLSDNAPKTMLRINVSLYDNQYYQSSYLLFKNFFKYAGKDWHNGYSYMALCCRELKKEKEFMQYLELAVKHNPREAKLVLGSLFPEGMAPESYVEYMSKQKNNQ